MEETRTLLRHLLATVAYRTRKCLAGAPDGLADFAAGSGVRTPAEIVRHMTAIADGVGAILLGLPRRELPPLRWTGEVARLEQALREVDAAIAGAGAWAGDPLAVAQGPVADLLTHAGQLTMLRRMAGAPLPPENFSRAAVRVGEVRLG
ncbi:MAG TPA: hypothetical protein VNM16_06665 [Bacillota bacterium]|nr:hypothetical protein [Bacillota bacterium]